MKIWNWVALVGMTFSGVTASAQESTPPRPEPATPSAQNQEREQPQNRLRARQQQNQTSQREQQNATGDQAHQAMSTHIANCLLLGNQKEIALLKYGMDKTQNPEVKQLTQKMIQDHEQYVQKLQAYTSEKAQQSNLADESGVSAETRTSGFRGTTQDATDTATQPDERDLQNQNRDEAQNAQNNERNNDARRAAGQQIAAANEHSADHHMSGEHGQMAEHMFQMEQKIAREEIRLTKEALDKEQGENFDKAFLGQQCGAHIAMLAKLKVAAENTNGDFQQVVQQGEQTTAQHKQHVESLMKKLESGNANVDTSNRRTDRNDSTERPESARRETSRPETSR